MSWDMAWREIISGERLARTEALECDIQWIMDRPQEGKRFFVCQER